LEVVMNNIKELTELYGVTAKTPDSLNIFITEIYSHGYHDGKEFSSTPISLRDHFAGLAMQTLPKNIPDMETLARWSYKMADAMMERREE